MASLWNRLVRPPGTTDEQRAPNVVWQDQFRDPALTRLLALELFLIFVATPLAAKGLPIARPITETMVIVVTIVGMLSPPARRDLGDPTRAGGQLAGVALGPNDLPLAAAALHRVGDILTLCALTWAV